MRSLLPDVPQIFVFDSSFFFQLPRRQHLRAEQGNRRSVPHPPLRAHGTSHEYISSVVPDVIGKAAEAEADRFAHRQRRFRFR